MAALEDAYRRYTESQHGQAVAGMYDAQTETPADARTTHRAREGETEPPDEKENT